MWSNQGVTQSANLVLHLLAANTTRVVVREESYPAEWLRESAGRWAGHLMGRHAKGSRIGLISENDEAFVVGYLACLAAGMVAVPMNPLSPGPERARDLASASIAEVFIGPSCAGVEESVRAAGPGVVVTILEGFNATGQPIDAVADAVHVEPDDVAVMLFTSGTAGPSKPAMLTHRNLKASLLSVEAAGLDLRSSPQAAVAVVPLFHVFGLNIILNLGLSIGATLVLQTDFVAEKIVQSVADYGVSILAGPPNMWKAISDLDPQQTVPLQQLLIAMSGAAPLDAAVANALRNKHHIDLREGYGLTETAGVLCSGIADPSVGVGSVGPVMPGVECRLVNADGEDVFIGDVGEVWVKGPMISPGYFEDEAATARSRTPDGWFLTGDLAVVDDNGHLSISGRTKDLVIVSGFNVHPAEVESILQSHPSVEAAAAVGVPDAATGERVIAFVVLTKGVDPAGIEDTLRQFCIEQLARYKVPKQINVVADLPVGIAGKLRRRDLSS